MVKDHSDSERGNPLLPHGLLFPINSKGSFISTIHRKDSTYHDLCYTSRGALAVTRNSLMGPLHEGSIRRSIALTTELHLAPLDRMDLVDKSDKSRKETFYLRMHSSHFMYGYLLCDKSMTD